MSKKPSAGGLVYSTDSSYFSQQQDEHTGPAAETAPKERQKLRVKTDSKQRAGKTVTLVEGFSGTEEDLAQLAKQLKTKCGVGGSAKDGVIVIQGEFREKILGWLREWGYKLAK